MKRYLSAFACGLLLFCACEKDSVSGNSLETENTVALSAVDADGNSLSNVLFRIRPVDFLKDTSLTSCENCLDLKQDSTGILDISELPKGRYLVEGIHENLRGVVDLETGETFSATMQMLPGGAVSGQLILPDSATYGWVQIEGLDYIAKTDSLGNFQLDSLPAGEFSILASASGDTVAEVSVKVRSKKTFEVGRIGKFQSTTPKDTVTQDSIPENDSLVNDAIYKVALSDLVSSWMLPLYDSTVLTLRLDTSSFDFSKVSATGNVLFSTSSSDTLAHRVVRYDSTLGIGIFQVRVQSSKVESDSLFISLGEGVESQNIWEGIPDSVRLKLSSVSFGGFESGNLDVGFPEPLEARNWYIVSSDSASMYTSIDSADIPRGGSAFRFSYDSGNSNFVLLGVPLNGYCNLSAFDSVAIWAKGNGVISFAFEKLEVEQSGKSWGHADLNTEWTRYVFTKDDLLPETDTIGENIGWYAVRDSVSNLAIFGYDGADLWIDDVTIYGVSRDDLK